MFIYTMTIDIIVAKENFLLKRKIEMVVSYYLLIQF
jgi:hypothetical protein